MKKFFFILVCLSVFTSALPQENSGSVVQTTASVTQMVRHTTMDSVFKSPQLPDSLLDLFDKANSIRTSFNRDVDSLKTSYRGAISRIDKYDSALRHRTDSLEKLKLPAADYTARLDSLTSLRIKTEDIFQLKLDALKAKSSAELIALDFPPECMPALLEVTRNIESLKINSDVVKIPPFDIPGYSFKEVGNLSALGLKGEVEQLGDFGNIPKPERQMGELDQVTQKLTGYQDDIKNVTEGNLKNVQQVTRTIEEQSAKVDGVEELQKQSTLLESYNGNIPDLKNPNKVKEQAAEIAKKVAVDHFAGKKDQLKTAMEKMAKYKQKFSSVSSLKNLPKSATNPMKNKPFVDRLVPGVYFQYQQKDLYLVDVNLYIGYKLTGRFIPGLGWNRRYAYDKSNRAFNSRSSIYGPRAFLDFKLKRGFVAHLEGEAVNSFVPWTVAGNPDAGKREWVWSFMTGIKKEYKVYKNLKGTALIQYNWFNRYYKAPYVDRLNSRIGFEYTLKKGRHK